MIKKFFTFPSITLGFLISVAFVGFNFVKCSSYYSCTGICQAVIDPCPMRSMRFLLWIVAIFVIALGIAWLIKRKDK